MEEKKQIKISLKTAIMIICIITIFIIGIMVMVKLNAKKDKDEIHNTQIPYKEDNIEDEIYNVQMPNSSELEKMEDTELSDLYYNISKGDEFVNETMKDYQFSYKRADSVEDAIEKTKTIRSKYSDNDEKILEVKLQDETDYYYIIYRESISYERTDKHYYLYFKNSILDIDNKTINTNILNNANKIKEIFNVYTYVRYRKYSGIKLLLPEITENSNEYVYSYYYFTRTSYGDWGVKDTIALYKSTTYINKQTGIYTSNDEMIRQFYGKTNDYPDWY